MIDITISINSLFFNISLNKFFENPSLMGKNIFWTKRETHTNAGKIQRTYLKNSDFQKYPSLGNQYVR